MTKRETMIARLEKIRAAIAAGMTVYYGVGMRVLKFTRRNVESIAVRGNSLYVRRGKRWDCIDYYTTIHAVEND